MKIIKFLILFICISLCSCLKEFRKLGPQAEEVRLVTGVRAVILEHNIDLKIIPDSSMERLIIRAPEKLLKDIETTLQDTLLLVRNNSYNLLNPPGEKIEVLLYTQRFSELQYKGSGSVTSAGTIQTPVFTVVSTTGAGKIDLEVEAGHTVAGIYEESADIILKGRTNTAYVYCTSRGTINLSELEANEMNFHFSAFRNGYIWVKDKLTGIIYHKGNLYLKGNPQLQVEERNSGRLLPF